MRYLTLITALVLSAFTFSAKAQMGLGKPKDIKELSSRKMIVILEEPDPKYIAKLERKGKTEEVEAVKKMYATFNETLQQAVKDKWTMQKEVEFKTWKEFKRMPDSKREKYAVMYFLSKRASSFNSGYVAARNLILHADMEEEKTEKHNFLRLFQTFTIDKAEDVPVDKWIFGNPVYTFTLPEVYPSYISVAYALESTRLYFDKRLSGEKISMKSVKKETAENSIRLKDKTLLIRQDWLDEDLTEEKIKTIYPHPVKVVDAETLDNAVRSNDKQYAWLLNLPAINSNSRTNSVIFIQQILDNEDYTTLLYHIPSMGKMMLAAYVGGKAGKPVLTEKMLKDMVEHIGTEEE